MNHLDFKIWRLLFALLVFTVFISAGCSSDKKCSSDSQCKDGSYCDENKKCVEFQTDDYSIVFENLKDGQELSSSDDDDTSKEGVQIDIALKLDTETLHDSMAVALNITGYEQSYEGVFINNRAVFSGVTIPFGSIKLNAFLVQNPDVKTTVGLNVKEIDIVPSYLKNGKDGTVTLLNGATVVDADDYDSETVNGIQLYLTAETEGIAEGETVVILIPEIQDEALAEGTVDAEGKVDFNDITIPIVKTIRMSLVNGDYKKSVEFTLDTEEHCGFLVNLQDNEVYGMSDDEDAGEKGLQYEIVISEIAGCGDDSAVEVYVDAMPGDGVTPHAAFVADSDTPSHNITINESESLEDTHSVFVKMRDENKGLYGTAGYKGILVDVTRPTVEITNPEVGDILNMDDDQEPAVSGLQINFEGISTDTLTKPVDVTVKLGETVLETVEGVDGQYTVPYSFSQSYETLVLYVEATDGAGNVEKAFTPFSVNIDTDITFQSICGKTGADIVPGMYLNAQDDENPSVELLQCTVVLKLADGTLGNAASLKVGDNDAEKRSVGSENTVVFNIELPESEIGIQLLAKAYQDDEVKDEISQSVRVDTVAPVATLSNNLLLNSGDTTSAVNITFNYSCSESGCSYNGLLDSETGDVFSSDVERVLTGLAGGSHSFTLRSRDYAGNISDPVDFNWTVDSEAPETTITGDPGTGTSNDWVLFTFSSSESGSTFECKLEKDSASYIPSDGSWEACNNEKRDYYNLDDGSYRFMVRASDNLGNQDPSPAEHEFIIGSEAPVTNIDSVIPDTNIIGVSTIQFNYSASTQSTFKCKLIKGSDVVEDWVDCSSGTKNYSSLENGGYVFYVRATSFTMIQEKTPKAYGFNVDLSGPVIIFDKQPAAQSPYDSGNIEFHCEDPEDNCTFECILDTVPVDCSSGSYSYSSLPEGAHSFSVKATDKAENYTEESVNWNIDSGVFGVVITSNPDAYSDSSSAVFEFSANQAATFECQIDSGAFEPCSSGKAYNSLLEGTHTFIVKASAGADTVEASYKWVVDTVDPNVTINLGPNDPTYETGAQFSFSANESVTFECKMASESVWTSCASPKIYPSGTFGVPDIDQNYTFEVRATDKAGNTAVATYGWTVDGTRVKIEWVSPAPNGEGKILVGKSDDVYGTDGTRYAINIKVKVSGSNNGQPINVTGFTTPPGYNVVNVDTAGEKTYNLVVGLQAGARVNNPLVISVSDDSGDSAQTSKVVIVNTEEPTISWAYPSNGKKFLNGGDEPKVIFNLWNAEVGTTVELVDADTENIIGTGVTVGGSGDLQEYVEIALSLDDRCAPYNFYATFEDTGKRYYTDATDDVFLKAVRSVTLDRNNPVIDSVTVLNVDDIDRVLNRADNQNPDPEGGMQTDISVEISDIGNSADSSRTVRVFTDNGSGSGGAILLNTLNNISDQADFEDVPLGEYIHSLRIEASDCSGNSTSTILAPITVDTVVPELALTSPKGSSGNWHWITTSDDPTLGTIDGDGDFTNVNMHINSSEELGSFVEVMHTVYNYSDVEIYSSDISSEATLNTTSVDIALPDLIYGKHTFEVTVEDIVGNKATIGDQAKDIYEVDVITPTLIFTNISGGETFSTDSDSGIPGFQIPLSMQFTDVGPESEYEITATPVLSQGGEPDGSRFIKKWIGNVVTDSSFTRDVTIGKGWWRITAVVTDDHENSSVTPVTGNIDIEVDANVAIIAVRKSYEYNVGTGPVLYGYYPENASYFGPNDLTCTGNSCNTELEVWTNAPEGSEAYISVNGGAEIRVDTVNNSGFSVSFFEGTSEITFDNTLEYNTMDVRLESTDGSDAYETYYVKLDPTLPQLELISPEDCSGNDVCRRLDVADNPSTTDIIELAEIGYGFEDDAVTGGLLNFKSSNSIIFRVTGAEAGKVTVGSVSGIENGTSTIVYNSSEGYYYADFENMTVDDTNGLGQKDYDLVFTVTEEPSGATAKYGIKIHLELLQPPAINIADNVDYNAKEAKISVDWVAIQGNSSTYGGVPGAIHEYEVKYQDYGDGVCTLAANYDAAKTPLETVAGPVPTPVVGNMDYDFYVNRLDNGKDTSDPQFREADIHKNGNHYCFGVRAVDAVYATDGTVLVKNKGSVLQEDVGVIEMNWSEIRGASPESHRILINNVGDIDRDGMDDFAVSDMYRSSNGIDADTAGNIQIYFSEGLSSFNKSGAPHERLGAGISSNVDFNRDGFRDFAYTNLAGEIFIHYGSMDGLNDTADVTFASKDDSDDFMRSMATGDFNGDGCDDIIIASPSSNGTGNAKGEVYIYYGRGGAGCPALPYDGASPDVVFEGENDNDKLGFLEMKSIGDADNDGKTDFAISNLFKVFVLYGGNETGGVISDVYSGFNVLPGERTGYGNFNGDSYSDMVIGDKSSIFIYYGSETGLSESPDITLNEVDVAAYTYTPDFLSFASAISHHNPDINGDGLSDLVTASSDGLFIYYTIDGEIYGTPSIYDSFVNTSSTRLLMLEYGIVYCSFNADSGNCNIMNYGE